MQAPVSAVCASIITVISIGLLPQRITATKSLEELVDGKTFNNKEVPGFYYVNSVRRNEPMTARITDAKRYRNKKVSFWLESLPPLNKRTMILDVAKSDKTGGYAVVLSETTSARHTDYSFDAENGLLQLIKDCMNEDSTKCPA